MNRSSYIVIDLHLPDAILLENRMRLHIYFMGLSAAIWINFYAHRKIGARPPPSLRDYVRLTRHEPSSSSTELSNHYYIETPIIVFDSWLNQGLYNILSVIDVRGARTEMCL